MKPLCVGFCLSTVFRVLVQLMTHAVAYLYDELISSVLVHYEAAYASAVNVNCFILLPSAAYYSSADGATCSLAFADRTVPVLLALSCASY